MKRMLFACLTMTLVGTGIARAQLANVPVYANPSISGFRIAGDYAKGMNDESLKHWAVAAQGHFGISRIVLGAGIGAVDFGSNTDVTYMGSLAVKVINSGLVAVALQGGVGFTSLSADSLVDALKTRDIPVSLGVGLHLPLVVVSIDPWVAPRYTFRRHSTGSESDTRNHFGVSAGVDATLLFGLGVQVAVDFQSLPALTGNLFDDVKREPFVFSAGLHFGI
ncbi:MAG: hypothetical protein IH616_01375 [Gemmatimonadales bacterium]|jgi:hypothetical protein|nr:hypothetical protein [Gemmatimonadales bacterium]